MIKNVKLNYDFSTFLNADYSQHEGSCIKHQVHELTDVHEQYGGFPKTYRYENTLIHQLWWDHTQIDFADIGQQLGMEVITISSIMQPPGCVIPWHRDTFFQINNRYPDRTELKVRANVYLEDWKMGHFLQYDDTVATHWKAGDGFMWDSEVLHVGANAGMENKFTLQVSGFLKHV
jgi:hypothetical protein